MPRGTLSRAKDWGSSRSLEGGWGCLYSGHQQGSRSGGPQASSHTSPSAHSRPQPPPSLISSTTGGSRGCSSSQEGPEGTEAGGEEGKQVCGFIGVPPQPQTGAPQDSKPAHPSLRPLRAEVTGKYRVWARPMGLPQARGGGGGLGCLLGAKPTLEGRTSMKQLIAGQRCTEPGAPSWSCRRPASTGPSYPWSRGPSPPE